MVEEEFFAFSKVMPDTSAYDANIDSVQMTAIADHFVGFATAPIGVYNYEMFECITYGFADKDQLDSIVDDNEGNILFYVTDNIIRIAEVKKDEE